MVSLSQSFRIDLPNLNLANESHRRSRESLLPSDLANRRYTVAWNRMQERRKPSASHDHVMAGESDPNFVIATLCVDELVPRQNHCLLRQNYFQRRGHEISGYGPWRFIYHRRAHVDAPFFAQTPAVPTVLGLC